MSGVGLSSWVIFSDLGGINFSYLTFSNGDTVGVGKYSTSVQTETDFSFSPTEPLIGLYGYKDSKSTILGLGMVTYSSSYCSSSVTQVAKIGSVYTNRQIPVAANTTSVATNAAAGTTVVTAVSTTPTGSIVQATTTTAVDTSTNTVTTTI